jgi:hypothetical protein
MHAKPKPDDKQRELTVKVLPTEAECKHDLCKVIFGNQCPFAMRFGMWVKIRKYDPHTKKYTHHSDMMAKLLWSKEQMRKIHLQSKGVAANNNKHSKEATNMLTHTIT